MVVRASAVETARTALDEARRIYAAALSRFRRTQADEWAEWAADRVERIVVEQFEITESLTDAGLSALKRLSGMAIPGMAARLPAEPRPELESSRWEAAGPIDAHAARRMLVAAPRDLPAELADALRESGYDPDAPETGGGRRSGARLASDRAIEGLASAALALAAAGDRARAEALRDGRERAHERWSEA